MSNVDFSKHSDQELVHALARIHRDRYPENYQNCLKEIESRKSRGVWSDLPLREDIPMETIEKFQIRNTLNGKMLLLYGAGLFLYKCWQWWTGVNNFRGLLSSFVLAFVIFGMGILLIRKVEKEL